MGKDLRLVLVARLLMSASRALAGVLVPIYLALLGFSATKLGLLFMAVAFAAVILNFTVGNLADRFGPKRFLVIFPLFVSTASVVFAFTSDTAALVTFAMIASFGRGAGAGAGQIGPYQPAESSLVATLSGTQNRNLAFSRISIFATLGALVGTVISTFSNSTAGTVTVVESEFRILLLITGVLALASALVVLPVKDPQHRKVHPTSQKRTPLSTSTRRFIVRLSITNTLTGLSVGLYGPFITFWFYRRYGVGASQIGAMYTIVNIVTIVSGVIAPKLASRYGLVRATVALRVGQSIMLIPWALAPSFALAGAFYAIRMIFQRASFPLRQSYAVGNAPEGSKARVFSISNLPSQIAMALTPAAAGVIYESVSLELPLLLGGMVQLFSTTLYYVFFKNNPPAEEKASAP